MYRLHREERAQKNTTSIYYPLVAIYFSIKKQQPVTLFMLFYLISRYNRAPTNFKIASRYNHSGVRREDSIIGFGEWEWVVWGGIVR